jgi:hypothetical protein
MEHFIKQNSQEPILAVTLYNDKKFFKEPFSERIENSIITFNMVDDKGSYKILDGDCKLIYENGDYSILYLWKKNDTKKVGEYKGEFKIQYLNDTYEVSSEVILPIKEELIINVI